MFLVRYINDKKPEIVFEGNETEIIDEIKKLNLVDWHDSYFYERGHLEKLGLGEKVYDYYSLRDSIADLNKG